MGYNAQKLQNFLVNNPAIELDTIIDALEGMETNLLCSVGFLDEEDLHNVSTVNLLRQSLKGLK